MWGTLSRGILAVSGAICGGVARGGGRFFFSRLQGGGRVGRPRACLGATRGPPLPPREGAVPVPGSQVQNKMTRIARALTGGSKIAVELLSHRAWLFLDLWAILPCSTGRYPPVQAF
jgi:hypothetical protein